MSSLKSPPSTMTSHVLCVHDLPAYSHEAHESVAAALAALPQAQLWFTYKDIQFFFGV